MVQRQYKSQSPENSVTSFNCEQIFTFQKQTQMMSSFDEDFHITGYFKVSFWYVKTHGLKTQFKAE